MQSKYRNLRRSFAVILAAATIVAVGLSGIPTRQAWSQEKEPAKGPDAKSDKKPADSEPQPTYKQVRTIQLSDKSGKPAESFCLSGGTVLACVGSRDIRVLSLEGKLLETWQLDFAPQVINVAPDGAIYVGGNGKLARLDISGKVVQTVDVPRDVPPPEESKEAAAKRLARIAVLKAQVQKSSSERGALAARTRDLNTEIGKVREQISKQGGDKGKRFEDLNRLLVKKTAAAEKQQLLQKDIQAASRELMELQRRDVEKLLAARRAVTGIAPGRRDLFVACRSLKGVGYEVWRMDRDFAHPKRIVERLSGCCGQMDIQTHGGDLFVAKNTAFQVARYDREGKQIVAWGSKDRKGVDGFGSCCNPMNICFDNAGNLYTSESNLGRIKCFTPDGKLLNLIGTAEIGTGCKRVTVAVSSDARQVFVLDGPTICVLEQLDGSKKAPK